MPTAFSSVGIPDAGQHQQLRRIDHAAGENDLARGVSGVRRAALHIFYADRARALKRDASGQRLDLQREIRSRERGPHVGDRGAAAVAAADGRLQPAETLLLLRVVVLGERMPGPRAGFQKRLAKRIFIAVEPRRQRSVAAAVGIRTALPRFLPPEIRKHVRVGPAKETRRRPTVVVAAMAPHISHRVDRGRSADDFAACAFDRARAELGLGLREIHPVVHAVQEQPRPAQRDVDPRIAIPAAGLQQQHLDRRVFGKPIGQHAARRPCADDDEVVMIRGHGLSQASVSAYRFADD